MGPDAPPGVAAFHDNLKTSQGPSAEGSGRKEALQSLRLSLPMQETRLCKHPIPPPAPVSPVTRHGQRPMPWPGHCLSLCHALFCCCCGLRVCQVTLL